MGLPALPLLDRTGNCRMAQRPYRGSGGMTAFPSVSPIIPHLGLLPRLHLVSCHRDGCFGQKCRQHRTSDRILLPDPQWFEADHTFQGMDQMFHGCTWTIRVQCLRWCRLFRGFQVYVTFCSMEGTFPVVHREKEMRGPPGGIEGMFPWT